MSRNQTSTEQALQKAAHDVFMEQGPGTSVAQIAGEQWGAQAALFGRTAAKSRPMCEALHRTNDLVPVLLDGEIGGAP